MDDASITELQHKEVLYHKMVGLYPKDPVYLRRLVELQLQQGNEKQALEHMRQLERLYKQEGYSNSAQSLKELRRSFSDVHDTHSNTCHPFLSGIKPEAIQILMRNAKRIFLNDGEILIQQGDSDDSMYIVLSGSFAVLVLYHKQKNPSLVHMLQEGAIVGEMAFLEGSERSASVIANEKSSVLKLSSKRVLQCLLKFPDVGDYLRQESTFRKHLTAITSNATLAKLPEDAKTTLASHAEIIHYPPFTVVSRASKKTNWVGIMVSGLIRTVAEDNIGNSYILEPVKPSDTIAEMTALQDEVSTSDMITVNDSSVLQIPMDKFRSVMKDNPSVRNRLIENHSKRISDTMTYINNHNK